MNKINVLIFPSSGENAYEIYDSLKYNINLNVYGVTTKHDFCEHLYPSDMLIIGDYNINKKDFDENFNDLLIKKRIDIVIPSHDTVAYYLANKKEKFSAQILTASAETSRICRNKIETVKMFKDEYFCPKFYVSYDENPTEFPVFLKPNAGQGAQGVDIVHNIDEYKQFMKTHEDYLGCEYLPGEEYTIDCFTDKNGDLKFVGPRTRENISNGISTRTRNFYSQEIYDIAKIINQKLKFLGAWFFQLKRNANGELKLLEIACRQAGTMMLYRQKGINFALLGVYSLMGQDVEVLENSYDIELDRRLEARYKINYLYNKVYIDYDDTLILNNKVVLDTIQFLYFCKNQNKEIYLITRHNEDHDNSVYEDLKLHGIDKLLFKDIICLKFEEEKYEYINSESAIFIDNSFLERKKVFNKLNIPVFDVDEVKGLICYNY